jgi:phage recombination protein Bet
MDNKLQTVEPQAVGFVPNKENVELLKTTLAAANTVLTDAELQLTIYTATQRGLNPLTKQMYVMKDKAGRISFITSIDGFRLIAQRTREYRGQVGPQWCGKDGQWRDVWLENEPPAAAKVGVYREGFKEAVYGIATWKSYSRTTGQWPTMGPEMLAKCAESLAFRKAFPEDLSGLYTAEEMDQAERPPARTVIEPANPDTPISNTSKQKLKQAMAETLPKGTDIMAFVRDTIQKETPETEGDAQALMVALSMHKEVANA